MIILRIFSGLIGVISGFSALVTAYLVYFSKSFHPSTGRLVDGFGNELSLTPPIIRFIFDADSLWAGPLWSVIYWVAIVALMLIAYFSLCWTFGTKN